MCPSGRGLVVGSYVPFRERVGGMQIYDFLVGVVGKHLCNFLEGCWF
jgi:hypothetical protein